MFYSLFIEFRLGGDLLRLTRVGSEINRTRSTTSRWCKLRCTGVKPLLHKNSPRFWSRNFLTLNSNKSTFLETILVNFESNFPSQKSRKLRRPNPIFFLQLAAKYKGTNFPPLSLENFKPILTTKIHFPIFCVTISFYLLALNPFDQKVEQPTLNP